jgi:hypothetical protein
MIQDSFGAHFVDLPPLVSKMNDLLFFAVTATLFSWHVKQQRAVATAAATESSSSCAAVKNSAFVFVKPHANTPATQKLVQEKLTAAGCNILTEMDIDGQTIDKQKLIDQHYYAIGAYVT